MARAVRRSMHQMGNTARAAISRDITATSSVNRAVISSVPRTISARGQGRISATSGEATSSARAVISSVRARAAIRTVSRVRAATSSASEPGRLSGTVSRVRGGYQQRQNQGGYQNRQQGSGRLPAAPEPGWLPEPSAGSGRLPAAPGPAGRLPEPSAGEVSARTIVSRGRFPPARTSAGRFQQLESGHEVHTASQADRLCS